jgi:hypothetical protein
MAEAGDPLRTRRCVELSIYKRDSPRLKDGSDLNLPRVALDSGIDYLKLKVSNTEEDEEN